MPPVMLPERLAHYRIVRPLGSGGMGEVYAAEDTRLGRRVALKVLAPAMAHDPERRDRFEREARAVAALNHPNIVTLHSIEQHDDVLFLTMELVEGRTLGERIPAQGMSPGELLQVAIPLVDAVGAAHQRGVTHRDLKPANVMLTDDGRVKVLDFGLAKLHPDAPLEADATMTAAHATAEGRIMGTFAYMSPEQAQGKAVDARSDIFSLGIVLYEMATGERPFKGNHISVLSAILKDTPTSVTDVRADLPRELARILKRCLAKDPEDRYQTAKDLRSDLRLLQTDLQSADVQRPPSRPSSAPSRSVADTTPSRPRWYARGAAALSLIAAIALVGWWVARRPPAPDHRFTSIAMRRLTNSGQASVAAISPDGRYVVHVVGARGRPSLWLRQVSTSSNVQIVAPQPGQYGGLGFSPDGESILYLLYPPNTFGSVFQVPLLGGPPRRLIDDVDTVPTFSPDGRQMAFVRDQGEGEYWLMLANADGSGQRMLAKRPARDKFAPYRMAWSPDGTTIATFAGFMPFHRSRVVLVDVANGRERPLGEEWFDYPGQIAWMPDGRTLVFDAVERGGEFRSSGQLWALSYPDAVLRRITTDVANYSDLSATRDGRALSAVQHEIRGGLWVAAGDDPARARALTTHGAGRDGAHGLDWTGDGRIVYTALTQGSWDLWITDSSHADPRQVTTDPGYEGRPSVLPDGQTVAFFARSVGEDEVYLRTVDRAGGNLRNLLADPVQPGLLQSAGDALFFRRVGVGMLANPVRRLPLDGGSPAPILGDASKLPPNFAVRAISSDGRFVLGTTLDPRVPGVTMVVLPIDGGPPLRTFAFESERPPLMFGGFGWAPGDAAVETLLVRDGAVNLWRFPFDGSPPRQLTAFTSDEIRSFAWSRDGKTLALSRGSRSADVVLITQP